MRTTRIPKRMKQPPTIAEALEYHPRLLKRVQALAEAMSRDKVWSGDEPDAEAVLFIAINHGLENMENRYLRGPRIEVEIPIEWEKEAAAL